MTTTRWEKGPTMAQHLAEMIDHHHAAMEDEGYSRPADRQLWAAVGQATTADAVETAIAHHRARIGVYALSIDEELWGCLEEIHYQREVATSVCAKSLGRVVASLAHIAEAP